MNVAPHLLTEDRAEYERILDDALRTAPDRPDLAGAGTVLTVAQLRSMAMNATALITTAASAEYEHFVKVRERDRAAATAPRAADPPQERGPGAGAVAVVTVLVPVLAGTAAAIFLLVGAVVHAVAPDVAFGTTLLTAGLVFGALAAGGLLCAGAGLLLTALRNSPAAVSGTGPPQDELSLARAAWQQALLERGVLPFLRAALTAGTPPPDTPEPPAPPGP